MTPVSQNVGEPFAQLKVGGGVCEETSFSEIQHPKPAAFLKKTVPNPVKAALAPKPQTANLPGVNRRIKVQTIQFGNDLCETVDVSKRDELFEAKITMAPTQLLKTIVPKARITTAANDTATGARPWTKESISSSYKNVNIMRRPRIREMAEVSVQNYPIEQSSISNEPKSIYGNDFMKKTIDRSAGANNENDGSVDMEVFIDTLTKFNQI